MALLQSTSGAKGPLAARNGTSCLTTCGRRRQLWCCLDGALHGVPATVESDVDATHLAHDDVTIGAMLELPPGYQNGDQWHNS